MKNYLIIFSLLMTNFIFAQEIDKSEETLEAKEIKLNDSFSFQSKLITVEEYTARKEQSAHLRHKPYKAITDVVKAKKMLGRRLKVIDKKWDDGNGNNGSYREHEITLKNGNKKHLDFEFEFVAYYPELKILLFDTPGGYYSVNFNNNLIESSLSPEYHSVSPNKRLRINAVCPDNLAKEDFTYFIEKWNNSRKEYEHIGDLFSLWGDNIECSWTDDYNVLCTYIPAHKTEEDRIFFEIKIIEK